MALTIAVPAPPQVVISATGITAPTYAQWLAWWQSVYQAIYGADIYLGNDSQDGQNIGIVAQALNAMGNACVATYNAFSPATAQGAGLASNVKINGLKKLISSFSTLPVALVGQANSPVIGLQVTDPNNNVWAVPATTIPSGGTVTVTAKCTVAGAVQPPDSGTTLGIQTPTYGLQTATAAAGGVAGQPVETDATLRNRQSVSTSLPAQTIVDGIVGAILNLTGVTRARGYENNTASVNDLGIAANSMAFVVEGGTQAAIINAIGLLATPGIPLGGNVTATYTSSGGSTKPVSYWTPTESTIDVALTIVALTGWSSTVEAAIQANIATYLSALPIGTNVSYTQLYLPAYAALQQYPGTYSITAMTIAKNGGGTQTSDITIAYNEAPVGNIGNVSITT